MSPEQLKRYRFMGGMVYAIVLVLLFAQLAGTAVFHQSTYTGTDLRAIRNVVLLRDGVDYGSVTLPITLDDVRPGERVTLKAQVTTGMRDSLLIMTRGASLKFYGNDSNLANDGAVGSYPSFQKGPASNVFAVALPAESGEQELRFDYLIPETLDSLTLPTLYLGDAQQLFMYLLATNGIPALIGLILIIGSFIILGIALMVRTRVPEAESNLWLGLACLDAGLWGFCGNDLAMYLIPAPNLLYVGSAIGLMYFAIPFLRYGEMTLNPAHPIGLRIVYTCMRVVFFGALILHILGIFPFAHSLSYMWVISLAAIIFFGFFALYEYAVHKNPQARSLGIPCIILTACALASLANRTLHLLEPETLLFQVGTLIFVVWTAFISWRYVQTLLDEADRSAQLKVEFDAMNRNLDLQRQLYNRLTKSTEEVRAVRHDLRHQLSAIRGYLQKNNVSGALTYVDAISGEIPEIGDKLLCDNFAVNAVAVHYLDKAQESSIQTDLRLVVPVDLGQIPDNDMSIIVGNLFENAIEACLFVNEDKRFIRMSSKVVKNRLTLVIDNSFDGTYTERGGMFYSRKRKGKGVGISSVRAVVERYGGSLKYEVANGVFMTSLYVKM
ncbi:MAG: GHKL domain-containing protein [Coriobacteriales bacterium]|jgi:hypothetical protein|nr:GHKL domain-containing protein [Coriobacteriales bacterium]